MASTPEGKVKDRRNSRLFAVVRPHFELALAGMPGFISADHYPGKAVHGELGSLNNIRFFASEDNRFTLMYAAVDDSELLDYERVVAKDGKVYGHP